MTDPWTEYGVSEHGQYALIIKYRGQLEYFYYDWRVVGYRAFRTVVDWAQFAGSIRRVDIELSRAFASTVSPYAITAPSACAEVALCYVNFNNDILRTVSTWERNTR